MTQATHGTGIDTPADALGVRFTPTLLDVRTELRLASPRRRVYDALLHVAAWWPRRVRAGASVVLEPRVGGRFFEDCDDGCGVLLGQVVRLLTPEEFAISGSFGLDAPVSALWSVHLDMDGHQATLLSGRFRAIGAIDDDTRSTARQSWQSVYAAFAHYLDA